MTEQHERAAELIKQDRLNEATGMLMDLLEENRDDASALFQLGIVLLKENRKGLAYNIFARVCKLSPHSPEVWVNFARAHADRPDQWGKSEWCLKKSLKLYAKNNQPAPTAYANLSMLYYIQGKLDQAQSCAKKALKEDPENKNALVTQGFIHLAQGKWSEAWHLYDIMLKTGKREKYSYGDEPEWNGQPGKRLVISGEQGIGDEIMYASCFNETIDDCSAVVIDCMPRLQSLLQRSFPKAKVYGQRWNKEVFWEEDHNPEAHTAMATLPKFYRNSDADFPGTPYLIPHPDIKKACAALMKDLGDKPKVGIAWTGGSERTRGYLRTRTLEELLPVLRQDVNWISLEYHDRSEEIAEFEEKRKIKIHSYPWLTKIDLDYDYTAALISELDLVISVPTTAVQTAGALGVPCWVMVPKYTGWIFARDAYPWAKSVIPMKNPTMKDLEANLKTWIEANTKSCPTYLEAVY